MAPPMPACGGTAPTTRGKGCCGCCCWWIWGGMGSWGYRPGFWGNWRPPEAAAERPAGTGGAVGSSLRVAIESTLARRYDLDDDDSAVAMRVVWRKADGRVACPGTLSFKDLQHPSTTTRLGAGLSLGDNADGGQCLLQQDVFAGGCQVVRLDFSLEAFPSRRLQENNDLKNSCWRYGARNYRHIS
ncbi:predicted protein [Uncinocarpus reesii 1704]|uniref:Uncharacterized protein n=1 Tax=Uncinocarpus reesii (strain UAMH 1704) TaxID=336963 RepID=C4JNL0_UNCRE|nr:uncharacterized protein UREG_03008 [Uncinocarpus reesii 1704]EEP78163.1 predicted protein [Uncinocarpus reesii 1704]